MLSGNLCVDQFVSMSDLKVAVKEMVNECMTDVKSAIQRVNDKLSTAEREELNANFANTPRPPAGHAATSPAREVHVGAAGPGRFPGPGPAGGPIAAPPARGPVAAPRSPWRGGVAPVDGFTRISVFSKHVF